MTPLPNYLRAHRKRLGLSQKDIAFLLGTECGAKVCRLERFVREPTLEIALAYEVICKKPIRELFAGHYQQIEKRIVARAKKLAEHPEHRKSAQKNKALNDIASKHSD